MYANIRGLLLKSDRSKTSILSDYLTMYNSLGLSICESWLNDEISDAEVQINNYSISRMDRSDRERGGKHNNHLHIEVAAADLRKNNLPLNFLSYN